MILGNGSVEAWMIFFLVQAVPVSAALVRLYLCVPKFPSPRQGKLVVFDGPLYASLGMLLLLDLIVCSDAFEAEWIPLAAIVSAVYTLILSAEFSSHAAVRRFAGRFLSPAPDLPWLAVSLAAIPALFVLGQWLGSHVPLPSQAAPIHRSFTGWRALGHAPFLFLTNAIFAGGIGGEPYWRGILYSRLRERLPFARAALVTGIAQAAWLVPGWLLVGQDLRGIGLLSVLFISVSPAFACVYERSHRSLLAVILLFGSMMTALAIFSLSFATVGAAILSFPAALFAERRSPRRR